jgi:PAS domain S-box-containing protein
MNLGLVELNSDGKVLMVNRSFKDISGYEQSDLLGNNLHRVLFGNTRDQVTHFSQIVDKRSDENLFELEVLNKKQEKRIWLVSETPNYGTDGEQTGYIGVYLDITEQKKLERQKEKLVKDLENSNNELQQYAHIVSHDLKSPLRSIDALVSWLREDNEGKLDENSLKNLRHIQTTLEHMENLISDILNHSGVRKDKLFLENVNVKEVIFDVIGVLNVPKHITVHVEGTLPSIKADKTMLKQLFQNLINNAVKYNNKEQGNVWVNFQEQNNNYLFCIKDDGIGIDKKFHKSIFKIFQSVTKNENSTGIGLAIVKKIVDLHQGEIWVKSELDRGSSFYFTLKK